VPGYDASPRIQGLKGPSDFSIEFLAGMSNSLKGQGDNNMVELSAALLNKAEQAFAKQDIHELIMGQARAIDRADVDLFKSLWFDDATVDVAGVQGSALAWVDEILDQTKDMKRMAHSVANEWIQLDGDTARSESYLIAFTTVATDDGNMDTLTGGRYLDAFEQRDGVWKYMHRAFVQDWEITQPSTDKSDDGMLATLTTRAGRFADDPVYGFWNA
jgi:hypothetical protein